MCSTMSAWLPDVIASASPAAGKRWMKDWEEVRVNGNLVCWEPKQLKEAA
jgi:hypothetical protein